MIILAFDPGMSLGYSVFQQEESAPFGFKYIKSGLLSLDSELPITARIQELKQLLFNTLVSESPDLIAVEAVNRVFGGAKNNNSDALYRIYGTIHDLAFSRDTRIVDIPIQTAKSLIKPFSTETLKNTKKITLSAVKNITGEEITDHNQADAVALGYATCHLLKTSMESKPNAKFSSDFQRDFRTFARSVFGIA